MAKEVFNPNAPIGNFCGCGISEVNITETAGFVDLETRFKRMEQSGYVAHFFKEMFDTEDERQIFLGEETEIYADDDEDTVREKLYKQQLLREQIVKSKLGDLAEANDDGEASRAEGSSGSKPSSQEPDTKE